MGCERIVIDHAGAPRAYDRARQDPTVDPLHEFPVQPKIQAYHRLAPSAYTQRCKGHASREAG